MVPSKLVGFPRVFRIWSHSLIFLRTLSVSFHILSNSLYVLFMILPDSLKLFSKSLGFSRILSNSSRFSRIVSYSLGICLVSFIFPRIFPNFLLSSWNFVEFSHILSNRLCIVSDSLRFSSTLSDSFHILLNLVIFRALCILFLILPDFLKLFSNFSRFSRILSYSHDSLRIFPPILLSSWNLIGFFNIFSYSMGFFSYSLRVSSILSNHLRIVSEFVRFSVTIFEISWFSRIVIDSMELYYYSLVVFRILSDFLGFLGFF